jgi:hypothetical protein
MSARYGRSQPGCPSAHPAIPDGSQTGVPQFQGPELRNARMLLALARNKPAFLSSTCRN